MATNINIIKENKNIQNLTDILVLDSKENVEIQILKINIYNFLIVNNRKIS